MKKMLKTALACALTVSALVVSSAAANFEHCADALSDLGLFQGSAQGYELDKAPTRAEAATMLVRLLGKEDEAKKLEYTAPFTDLKGWEAPYVQYLYDNKLTSGMTETAFAPDGKCSAKMYTTFLLRALGYSDAAGGDFAYNDAVAFAQELGLADYANCSETNFLRDNVAAMSYTALACAPKGETDKNLLDELTAAGAVDKTKAAAVQKTFDTYLEYLLANEETALQTKMDMDADVAAKVKLAGTDFMSMDMAMNIKADMDLKNLDKSRMAVTGEMKAEVNPALAPPEQTSMESKIKYYFADGVYYMDMDGEKYKMPMSFADLQEQMGDLTGTQAQPVSMVKSIEKSGSTYSMVYQMGALNGMMDSVLQTMGTEAQGVKMSIGEVTAKVVVAGGKVSAMDMTMAMAMSMTAEGETMDMTMDMTVKSKVNALGDSVKVTLPDDLASYQEMPKEVPAAA